MTAAPNLQFDVHDAQRRILMAATAHRFLTLTCGRRFGKDHLAAIKIITHSFGFKSPRGKKLYAWINPVYNPQGVESFRVFMEFAGPAGLVEGNPVRSPPMKVTLVNGDEVRFYSADNPDNLRGGQFDGIIVNEAAMIANLKDIWAGPLAAMLIDREGWAWLMSTPKGKNDYFEFHNRGLIEKTDNGGLNPWKSFRFPSYANPYVKPTELDRLKEELPRDLFEQEILASFIDGAGTVFKGIEAMRKRSEGMLLTPQAGACRVGMDIARHTDFTALVALDPTGAVVGFDRFNQLDWETIKKRVLAFCTRYRGVAKIDVAGAGDQVFDYLLTNGVPAKPAKFTNDSKTGWVQNLMTQIEEGVIKIPLPGTHRDPAHDTTHLWKELGEFSYEVLPSGRFRYGAPAGKTDDCVTALYLAASEVPPFSQDDYIGVGTPSDLNDVYEVGDIGL